jgi:hypothetical protein
MKDHGAELYAQLAPITQKIGSIFIDRDIEYVHNTEWIESKTLRPCPRGESCRGKEFKDGEIATEYLNLAGERMFKLHQKLPKMPRKCVYCQSLTTIPVEDMD